MHGGRHWLRKAGMLLALGCVGAVSALATTNLPDKWAPDPDEQYLLDVNIRQIRLGDGVRAYNTPTGTCVVLGDFLSTLDVPITVDLAAKRASGWAFKESNRIAIDYAGGTATYRGTTEPLAPGTIRETPEGWCADTKALARWFGIGVKPLTAGSVLVLESEVKLPVELALERQARANRIAPGRFDLTSLPRVKLPYRMWRAPALDFVVSGGVTYRANDGVRVDRRTSVYAAGEIAHLSYDAQFSTNDKGKPVNVRFHAFRSDPDGALLGPLKATHIGLGDVAGLDSRLTGSGASGRGAVVTNRPQYAQTAFDRTRFEGDLPGGWEAEIYRNGELLAFAKPTGTGRYVFDDVQLLYGENRVNVILYGPQGQIRSREEVINVGQDNVPPGKTWYWAGINQPGRDLALLHKPPDAIGQPQAQATVAIEHGIDERTSVGLIARAMLIDDERLTFVEGSVRRSIGAALIEVAAGYDSKSGRAARAQLIGKIGPVNVNAAALIANDFHLRGGRSISQRSYALEADAPLKLGRTVLPVHAGIRFTDDLAGTRQLEAAARLSANIDRFNLGTSLAYRRQYLASGPAPPGEFDLGLIGSGRVGAVRLRGETSFSIAPQARFRTAELSAYWSASDKVDWQGAVIYDANARRGRAQVTHVRRLNAMAIALTGEMATDGSVAVGFNLNFSLDPRRGLSLSRRPLASAGAVRATVYRDLNDNGRREANEPAEQGALITTGRTLAERTTDAHGGVLVGGLAPFTPVTVGIDETSLSDPMLVPRKALQLVVPRPGVPVEVEIGLVGGGDIEGAIVKNGSLGFEGLDLELVDATGKTVATARTDFDGFFLFERVAYGQYRVRLAAASAAAAHLAVDLDLQVRVSADKSIVRLGAIYVTPVQQIAQAEMDDAATHSQ